MQYEIVIVFFKFNVKWLFFNFFLHDFKFNTSNGREMGKTSFTAHIQGTNNDNFILLAMIALITTLRRNILNCDHSSRFS